MRPLRIIQVVHSFPPHNTAGTEVYTYNLSCALAKRHEVFVFHRINDKKKNEFEIIRGQHNRLHIYAVNNTFTHCDSFEMTYDNNIITYNFARLLEKIKPDIIHIQHLLFLSIGIIEAAKQRNIPIVFTLNDYWLLCPQGQLFKHNKACREHSVLECVQCMKYQLSLKKGIMNIYWSLRNMMPVFLLQVVKNIYFTYARISLLSKEEGKKQIALRERRFKQACAKIDIFLAPSEFLRRKFMDFGIPENKIVLCRYGLITDYFRQFKRDKSDKVCFAFMGTLLPSKGVHVLLQAFNRMKQENAELKIFGSEIVYKGFEYYLAYIKKMGKHKNIHFMGGYKNEDIGKIFSEIDVLVVPSIWYENAPLVIQEAFLAKTPVIVSRIGGIPELIDDGVNGLLFAPGDSRQLQEKMQYVVDNPDFLKKVRSAMPVVEDIESHAKKIEMLYSELLAEKVNYEAVP